MTEGLQQELKVKFHSLTVRFAGIYYWVQCRDGRGRGGGNGEGVGVFIGAGSGTVPTRKRIFETHGGERGLEIKSGLVSVVWVE